MYLQPIRSVEHPSTNSSVSLDDQYGPFSVTGGGPKVLWSETLADRSCIMTNNAQELTPFKFAYIPTHSYRTIDKAPFICSATTAYVEDEIRRPTSTSCAASSIHRSHLDQPPPAYLQMHSVRDSTNNGRSVSN